MPSPSSVQTLAPASAAPDRLTLARDLSRQGRPERAYAIALDLHEQAAHAGDEAMLAKTADCLAYCCIMLARYEQGVGFARVAVAIWRGRQAPRRLCLSLAQLALLLAWIGEPDALADAEAALEAAEGGGDDEARAWALTANGLALVLLKQPDQAVPCGERAVALGPGGLSGIWSRMCLSEALVWRRLDAKADGRETPGLREDVARAVALTREALLIARDEGDLWMAQQLVNNIAEYSLYVGDTRAAEAALAEFPEEAEAASRRCLAHNMLLRGRMLAAQGRGPEALAATERASALTGEDDMELATMCQLDLSDAYARLGAFEAALAAHRAYHHLHVRRASEAAERRARLFALRKEAEALRQEASHLHATNELLAREAERLLRTSLEDPLTGLANRRRMDVALLDLLAAGDVFALAIVDVDHFKQVNDRFSHSVGDAVLRALAGLLSGAARRGDLAVRLGGEEFALLLRGADLASAAQACERLRAQVERHDWGALRPGLAVTASIGVAASPEAGSHDDLLALADQRLYEAKRGGRNRVAANRRPG